jgi:opacity protein-like surface antigen
VYFIKIIITFATSDMKKLLLFLSVLALGSLSGYSQALVNETLNRDEYTGGLGLSAALTDIGGSPSNGTHFLKDFNPGAIRYGGFAGYRKKIAHSFSVKGILTIAELYGNDDLSSDPIRFNRNQNFRTLVIEPSVQAEYHFYQYNQEGHKYKIRHAHGFHTGSFDCYIFAGIGGLYFNPQGKYNGTWYSLRPLSTEGEGLPGGPPEYSPVAFCIPAGLGLKYKIDESWSVGLEFSDRLWTSTDYLDDTHGTYFSPSEIQQYKGPVAAYFSHPVLGYIPDQDGIGEERGDPTHNDTYMFMFLCVNYHIDPHHRRGRSKF